MYNKLERFRNLENRCYEGAVKDNIGVWINLKQLNHLKQMFASNKKWFLKLGNAVLSNCIIQLDLSSLLSIR